MHIRMAAYVCTVAQRGAAGAPPAPQAAMPLSAHRWPHSWGTSSGVWHAARAVLLHVNTHMSIYK